MRSSNRSCIKGSIRNAAFVTGLLASSAAIAGQSAVDMIMAGMPDSCADYAANVSKSEGNWGSVNPFGCVGAFQFCPGTLESYYSGTREQFAADPNAQVQAWLKYQKDQWNLAQRRDYTSILGKEICYQGQCATVTESSILKACQFGCGKGGKLDNLINNGFDCDARSVKDGNKLSVCKYLISASGYDASCITGGANGDVCPPGTVIAPR